MPASPFLMLLDDFSRASGLPRPEPDSEGFVTLGADDRVVHLRPSGDERYLEFFGSVGELPANPDPSLLERLLEANLAWQGTRGATLGLDRNSRMLLLCRRIPQVGLQLAEFQQTLEDFFQVLDDWANRL
ncbi:putative Tir chaperone family protein [Gammaproteobacteria bacterium]